MLRTFAVIGLVAAPLVWAAPTSAQPVSSNSAASTSCDVLVTLEGSRDSLFKITPNGVTSEVKLADFPIDVVSSSDGRTAFVAGHGTAQVFVVDVATMTKVATIATKDLIDVALSADDRTLYVAVVGGVQTIDTTSRRVTGFIEFESSPYSLDVSPDGSMLYVLERDESRVTIFDMTTGAERQVTVPASGEAMTVSLDGRYVFTTHPDLDRIARLRVADLKVDSIEVGDSPRGIEMSPNGRSVYVVNQEAHSVSVVDIESSKATRITVGDGAYDVTFDNTGQRAYVNNYWDDNVSVIDTATNRVIATLPLGADSKSWGIDTACRSSNPVTRPTTVNDLFVFANFFCGPCTNAWLLFTRPANTTDFSVYLAGQRATCTQKGYFFDLALCELTRLAPGVPLTVGVVPLNGTVLGSTAFTSLILNR